MGFHYRIHDKERPYFITTTVVDWIDVFIRKNHKQCIVDALAYCQKNKGLKIYAWCLMPSHLHMIVGANDGHNLSDIIRDFKRYTSKNILRQIIEEPESRRDWMLKCFSKAASEHPKAGKYKFWQDGYRPIVLYSPKFTFQKLHYIHNNPVEEMLVSRAWDYTYSSARNYTDLDGLLDVIKIE